VTGSATAQNLPSGEQLTIGVVTFGRGDEVHQYFGHNAFVVHVAGMPDTAVFNYGMFKFGPDMIPSFLHGRLKFWVGTTALEPTSAKYAEMNRDVRILELDLSPAQRVTILKKLLHDTRPENREYLYDHYYDNCSTRVRDVIDAALNGQLRKAWSKPSRFTLRQETRRYTQQDVFTEWSMMLLLSGRVDRPQMVWGDAFLPLELEHMLESFQYVNDRGESVPLVARKRTVFSAKRSRVPDAPPLRWPYTLAIGVAIAALFVALARFARTVFLVLTGLYGFAGGVVGTLLVYLWAFSDHLVSHGNFNVLLLNPVTLLAGLSAFAAWITARAERVLRLAWLALAASSVLLIAFSVFGLIAQDSSLPATLLAPIHVGLARASHYLWSRTHPDASPRSGSRATRPVARWDDRA
jgi:hypothetical protein